MTVLSVRVDGPADVPAVVARLVEDRVASRLAAKDPTLWGADAEEEAAKRLGWVDLPLRSAGLLDELDDAGRRRTGRRSGPGRALRHGRARRWRRR